MGKKPRVRPAATRSGMTLTQEQRLALNYLKPADVKQRREEPLTETIWWHYFWQWRRHVLEGRRIHDRHRMEMFLALNRKLMAAGALNDQQRQMVEILLESEKGKGKP